jgi:hypothetical protein
MGERSGTYRYVPVGPTGRLPIGVHCVPDCALCQKTVLDEASSYQHIRHSIVASIPACHAGDRGSIPRDGELLLKSLRALPTIRNFVDKYKY